MLAGVICCLWWLALPAILAGYAGCLCWLALLVMLEVDAAHSLCYADFVVWQYLLY